MSDELAFHLDMETEQNIRAGMSPAEARRAAVLAFGGVDRFAEQVRDVRNFAWLEDLAQDLRHAARGFRRTPGFTLTAIAALALGIGANTAVFSVVHAVLLAPLPYAEPDRLVRVWESNPAQGIDHGNVSPGTFADLHQRSRTLDRIALFGGRDMMLSNGGETWEARASAVSPALFETLGVRPLLGGTFSPEGDGPASSIRYDEVVIGHGLWQRRHGGDPDILGRTIRVDFLWSYTVVGVMPPGFAFPEGAELWMPLTYSGAPSSVERQFRYHGAIGRLREGHTLAQARAEATAIAAQLETEHPASNAGWTLQLARLDDSIVAGTRPTLLILLGLAACVLLIAGGNVATLAVARATARSHETAVRAALGAGRRRLLRQWMAEGLLLAVLGGAVGLLVGWWSSRLLLAVAPADIPRLDEARFGGPVLAFALLATCATAIAVGLAPALRSGDATRLDAMRSRTASGGPAAARTREWLVGAQVALTVVLTVAAALLVRSFERLQSTDLGYSPHDVLAADVRVPIGRFGARQPRPWFERVQFYDLLMEDLGALPGVRSVAGTTTIPLTGELGSGSMWRTDAPGAAGRRPPASAADQWKAAIQMVTPRYLETMGIPLLRGRGIDDGDRFTEQQLTDPGVPRPPGVAVINEAMARRFWPDGDPLGATIFLFDDQSFAAYRTIIGIVADVRAESVDAVAEPTVFLPFAQHPGRGLSLVLRTAVQPEQLVTAVTERLRAFDPAISVVSVRPLEAVVGGALSRPRFAMMLVGSFAALALIIAGVGIFGIVGFLVARRKQEIGIRMALGARGGSVVWLVLREGLRPVVAGIVLGALGALGVARAMQAMLYGLAPTDVVSFVASTVLLLFAAGLAALLPARRAAGIDPLLTLRSE